MKKKIIDAAMLLAFLQGESDSELAGMHCKDAKLSALHYAEVLQRSIAHGRHALVDAIINQAKIQIMPFDRAQATLAAELYKATKDKELSLADIACLALGVQHNLPIISGESGWTKLGLNLQITHFRDAAM